MLKDILTLAAIALGLFAVLALLAIFNPSVEEKDAFTHLDLDDDEPAP